MGVELKIRRVVITGPTGAVGTALIEELIRNGVEIAAVCRPGSKRIQAIPHNELVRIVECGLEDYADLAAMLQDEEPFDAFYHFAWDGTYGPSRLDWHRQARNINYSIDAVYAAHKLGCQVFIGAGSQSEFGPVDGILRPDLICAPNNGYGASKYADCIMTRALCEGLGMRHEWCRILSAFGPRDGAYTLIATCIKTLLSGKHLACTRGDQIWDYIYSKDVARAFRLVAEKGKDGSIYLFGTGKTKTLREYIETIRDLIDPDAQIGFGEIPYYPNQVMHLEADIQILSQIRALFLNTPLKKV